MVKYALTTAIQKRIPPMKLVTLMDRNLELHNILYKQNNKSWFYIWYSWMQAGVPTTAIRYLGTINLKL